MPDADLTARARLAAAGSCRERAGLLGELIEDRERLRAERDALRGLVARLAVMAEDFRRDEQPHVDAHYPGLVEDVRKAAGLDRGEADHA